MSSVIIKEWSWIVKTKSNSNDLGNVNIFYWESDTNSVTRNQTDSNGDLSLNIIETRYIIDNETDITEENKNPYTLSICKYSYKPLSILSNFTSSKTDTFYLETNEFISENDESVVDGYTGINIDHINKKITISENHTIDELYDFCQHNLIEEPQKDYPEGIFKTNDGFNYYLYYDLTIDGCDFSGGKFIDMSNNVFELINGATSNVKVKDINGVDVIFKLTGIKENSEIRIYKKDDLSELTGVESLSGNEFLYRYKYTEDTDVIVTIFNINYDPIRFETTLTQNDTTIPIQQQYDRNYKNP